MIVLPLGLEEPAILDRLRDPRMTTENNPLARDQKELAEERVIQHNVRRLRKDECMRSSPTSGHVYATIMDKMRYKTGE